ncbi:MAG: cob(I)yrinic acid a,c-diamide adenosyltransferase [Chitinophagales bacterium]
MKIYTKKGDQGKTSLLGGSRVSKADLRIESYGTVDELNSYLGLLRDHLGEDDQQSANLLIVQEVLFSIGAQLANDPEHSKFEPPKIKADSIEQLEIWIDEMEQELSPMRNFILPGGHIIVSHCHIARCVCRRAERAAVRLQEYSKVDVLILSYLNRLSDYLFVLSRKIAKNNNAPEIPWKPRG